MSVAIGAMGALPVERERRNDRARTRWSMISSVVGHVLLLLWFVMFPPHQAAHETLTEITMLDESTAGTPAAPAAAAAATAEQTVSGAATAHSEDARFRRIETRADVAPAPQVAAFTADRLNSRLAALQHESSVPAAGIASAAPTSLWGASPATTPDVGGAGASPVRLTHGGAGAGPPLALSHGTGRGLAPTLANAAPPVERSAAAEPARGGGDAGARRTLAGATLMGPIADRPVVSHVAPAYPEWAKQEAVEGSVTLYFVVGPDGSVRENVLVQKTAGFEDFDENARSALRAWRFQPLRGGRTGDQWGTITFHFRLQGGG